MTYLVSNCLPNDQDVPYTLINGLKTHVIFSLKRNKKANKRNHIVVIETFGTLKPKSRIFRCALARPTLCKRNKSVKTK